MSQLAWIGLGNMGRGMVKNIAEKADLSKPILIYNRTTKRATDLQAKVGSDKATVIESIPEAVKASDIIFTCVGDDKAINETIDVALASGDVSGKLFVDCSTVHPETTNALASKIEGKGAHFVACPVFGAPAMADNGQLICVLAGKKADVEKVKPYCKGVMGRAEVDFSDQEPGQAGRMKLIGNSFILQMVEALSLGHTLAEKTGLGPENLHKFVEQMFPGPYTAYSNRMLSGDYHSREEPLFNARLARKDAKHVMDLANANGAKARAVELIDEHLASVVKEKGEKGDIAGIYGAVRLESGLPFDNSK